MFTAIFGALSNLGGIILAYFKRRERAELRKAGTQAERLRTVEGNIDAAKRKKKVDHETDRIGSSNLRDALGRFVSNDRASSGDE